MKQERSKGADGSEIRQGGAKKLQSASRRTDTRQHEQRRGFKGAASGKFRKMHGKCTENAQRGESAERARKGDRMDRRTATDEIKRRWKELFPVDGSRKGVICPLCGNGSGKDGDGIRENPKGRNHGLICFKCGFSGSVIDLFMAANGMNQDADFSRAVDELAAQLGLTIEHYTHGRATAADDFKDPEPAEAETMSDTSFTGDPTPAAAAEAEPADYSEYYQRCIQNLIESPEAQAYLKRRGISFDTAVFNGVGYDPEWISPTVIKNLQAKGSNWRPPAKPVIILPSGPAHYVARDIRPADMLDEQQRKFQKMNEGTPGIFGAKALEYDTITNVFVTEGAFDALSILEAGQAAISLNSTSNAEKLIKMLEQRPTAATLLLALDNDEAGKKAAETIKQGLQRLNISYVTADICNGGKDPNEALIADRAAFEAAINRAIALTAARPDDTAAYVDGLMAGEIEKFKQSKDRLTGFSNLDAETGGLYNGLYLLAAISSLGKTTFAAQMADQLAAAGHDVLFFSMEQSRLELVTKSLARLTAQADMSKAVDSLSIRKGCLPSQVTEAARKYKEMTGGRLSIIEGNYNADTDYLAEYVRNYKRRNGVNPVVIIDYLQALQPAAKGKSARSKKDEIDLTVTELKRLSRAEDLPIIAISSLNRANYLTPFSFESLKESGNLEYTADVVWGLQLACLDEELFSKEGGIKAKRERVAAAKAENPRKIKFICLKNRFGRASFEITFEYFPAADLFIPGRSIAATIPNKAGRKIPTGRR